MKSALKLKMGLLLLRARTPWVVWARFVIGRITKNRTLRKYATVQAHYEKSIARKHLSINWFSSYIPRWCEIFTRTKIDVAAPKKILEIGSFEGNSSSFILETFQNSTLVCVDTWSGSDEHQSLRMTGVEENFDFNTAPYVDRLTKFKGTSFQFFNTTGTGKEQFDLIYVDGSHYIDDVLIDAVRCFSLLKIGGVMIFDDYLSVSYHRWDANPALAINTFLRLKKKYLRIVSAYGQLAVMKAAEEDHLASQVVIS